MAFGWDDLLMIGAPMLINALSERGGGKAFDVRPINDRYMSQRNQGWLNEEDMAQSERFRNRGKATMAGAFGDERARAIGRAASRNTSDASLNRNLARLTDMEAAKAADINLGAEEQLYRTRMGREAEMNDRMRMAWGAELGAAGKNFSTGQERSASMWNSILEMTPAVIDAFRGGTTKTAAGTTKTTAAAPTPRPDSSGLWEQGARFRSGPRAW